LETDFCMAGATKKYKCTACQDGYTMSSGTCTANACTGYGTTQNITGCMETDFCMAGATKKFKCTACQSGYALQSDSTCKQTCSLAGYDLDSCPANATCEEKTCGSTTKYKMTGCQSGYNQSGNTCVLACSLDGYDLTSCPANATCESKTCNSTTKYKMTGCESGYNPIGNTCQKKNCIIMQCYSPAAYCHEMGDGTIGRYSAVYCDGMLRNDSDQIYSDWASCEATVSLYPESSWEQEECY
ncbi:MAG: hypothetical protein IJ660_08035, partial [Alphaproteobacteria bacterium]|nr:hypothetical protein [Alphaproteobacteria bacterium]